MHPKQSWYKVWGGGEVKGDEGVQHLGHRRGGSGRDVGGGVPSAVVVVHHCQF